MAKASATTKFSKVKRDEYLQLLRDGQRRGLAARAVGVDPRTAERLRHDDPDFAADCDRAEMEAHEIIEDALFQAARKGNVRAIERYLENRLPERWKPQRSLDRLEVIASASAQVGVTVDASHLDSEIDRELRALADEVGRNAALREKYGREREQPALPASVEFEPAP